MPVRELTGSKTGGAAAPRRGLPQVGPLIVAGALVLVCLVVIVMPKGKSGHGKPKAAPVLTVDKAVFVATGFDQRWQRFDDNDEQTALAELTAVAAPQFAPKIEKRIESLYEKVQDTPIADATPGSGLIARNWPLTYKVAQVDPKTVNVTIWSATMAAVQGDVTPRVSWMRNQVTVGQIDGAWRVTGYKELAPLVPSSLATDEPTNEYDFWKHEKGATFYDSAL